MGNAITKMIGGSKIPVISQVANVASPFLRMGSDVASLMGFSKPISE